MRLSVSVSCPVRNSRHSRTVTHTASAPHAHTHTHTHTHARSAQMEIESSLWPSRTPLSRDRVPSAVRSLCTHSCRRLGSLLALPLSFGTSTFESPILYCTILYGSVWCAFPCLFTQSHRVADNHNPYFGTKGKVLTPDKHETKLGNGSMSSAVTFSQKSNRCVLNSINTWRKQSGQGRQHSELSKVSV